MLRTLLSNKIGNICSRDAYNFENIFFFSDFAYVIALMFYLQQIQIYYTLKFIASEIIATYLSALH